jgi:hypothetical protein
MRVNWLWTRDTDHDPDVRPTPQGRSSDRRTTRSTIDETTSTSRTERKTLHE